MNDTERLKLLERYKNLIEVSYSSISAHLISKFVIDLDMHAEIDALPTDRKKIEKLLSILPSRGSHAFKELVSALKPNYHWIADQLSLNEDLTSNVLNNLNSSNQHGAPHNMSNSPIINTGFGNGNSENLKDISISNHLIPIGRIFRKSVAMSRCGGWCMLANEMKIDRCALADIKRHMGFEGGIGYAINSVLEAWVSQFGPSKTTFSQLINIAEVLEIHEVTEPLTELWRSSL